ncbi:hypothetical protein BHE74_00047250 [Ensete ventricosum]|nr:hypothetical protein BHE74_00047250 [Ensete ventricosum]
MFQFPAVSSRVADIDVLLTLHRVEAVRHHGPTTLGAFKNAGRSGAVMYVQMVGLFVVSSAWEVGCWSDGVRVKREYSSSAQFPVSPTKSDLDREQGERDPYHWLSAAFGIDDALPPALGAFSSFYPAEDVDSPGVSVGVAPGGGSIPASSDGYGFSSAMTETDETVHRVEEKGRLLHPDPDQTQREEGFILREWRRRGAFLLDPIIRRFGAMVRPPKAHAHDGRVVVAVTDTDWGPSIRDLIRERST